jgi:hypothetical protein
MSTTNKENGLSGVGENFIACRPSDSLGDELRKESQKENRARFAIAREKLFIVASFIILLSQEIA